MRRTQIYIDEKLDEQLRQRAAAEGRSAAALIREALGSYLSLRATDDAQDDPIRAMAGTLRGLPGDASVEHDRDIYHRRRSATRRGSASR